MNLHMESNLSSNSLAILTGEPEIKLTLRPLGLDAYKTGAAFTRSYAFGKLLVTARWEPELAWRLGCSYDAVTRR